MSPLYDLAVIGGGPAGSAAAITASRNGARVLLLDRDTFPRHKVCGEFVSPDALGILARLLGRSHPLVTESLPIGRSRIFIGGQSAEIAISPAARSIPRYDLDFALWKAAESSGVNVRCAEAVTMIAGTGPFVVHTVDSVYAAKAVINASGRWSSVLQKPVPPAAPKWIGLKAHYAGQNTTDSVDLYFFRHGYCGVQPVRDGVVNVCAMVRADVATDLVGVFTQHHELAAASADWVPATDLQVTAPLVHASPIPVQHGILQAGDAAGFIDPFLGDGISLALHSGTSAADALAACIAGRATLPSAAEDYAVAYTRRFTPAFRAAARLRRLLWLAQPLQPVLAEILKSRYVAGWLWEKTRPQSLAAD